VEECRCQDVPLVNVRTLPFADPGTPDLAGPWRLLGWIARGQWLTLGIGMIWGTSWMVCQALIPVVVGRGVAAVVDRDRPQLLWWAGAVVALAVVQAGSGVLRHRAAVSNWLQASFRIAQLLGYQTADAGEALPRSIPTGEVVSTVTNDAMRLGGVYDVTARFTGAVVSYLVAGGYLLSVSTRLGLLVLIGVPALSACLGLMVPALQRRQATQREQVGRLTTLGADTVAGLRVLRGIGGEHTFVRRYRRQSQAVRAAGVRVSGIEAGLDAGQILLPGVLVVVVTWLGARLAVSGEISLGELVTFYGLTAFLVTPLRTATEMLDRLTRAHIGAKRIISVLRVTPMVLDRTSGGRVDLPTDLPLHDPTSGVTIAPGRLTAVVSARPEESAALADRLGRFVEVPDAPVLLGGQRIDLVPLAALRQHVVVSESDPRLFTGPLRAQLVGNRAASTTAATAAASADGADGADGDAASDRALARAIDTAAAHDVLDALPDGIDSDVEERGRSFSGGQRQRLALARALLTDAPTLVLVEPTSAVDAHTEMAVAARLREHRSGRTTVVMTASPLLLDQTDHVIFLDGGAVAAEGTHRHLLASQPAYRRTVIRGEDE
jgi:ABC-type multidrug transport system fused ATPase/permease subunit